MKQTIPRTNNPLAYNYYALLLAIMTMDMPPSADAAFQAMETGKVPRVNYSMPMADIIDSDYLNRTEGWHYKDLSEVTGYSVYKVFRNVKKYRNIQPLES